MSAPRNDTRGEVDDEEAAFPPREISFRGSRGAVGFNNDDDTIPSELSTLIAPSTLTPNYHHDPVLLNSPEAESSQGSAARSRKAFQLAALLGILSIGALFGADGVYVMVTSSNSNDVSQVSSTMNMDTLDLDSPSAPSERRGAESSEIYAAQGQKEKISKKAKAKKGKTGKEKDEKDGAAADDDEINIEDGEEEEKVDELVVPTPRKALDVIALDAGGDDGRVRDVDVPEAHERCPYVVDTFRQQNEGVTNVDFLREKYRAQSANPNVFYRATALLFWKDFGSGHWGREQNKSIDFGELVSLGDARYEDGTPLSPMSAWTWITGDQHLSNFGAWRNRGGEVVFSVNDFDEAAIYDFHMDVLRIVVSIVSHGFTNGLSEDDVKEALEAFTYTYVKTAIEYVGGDTALVYELTPDTATGALRDFLWDVREKRSQERLMDKFTEVGDDGIRRFVRNEHTRLQDVPPEIEEKIRSEITPTRYGASMMKMGWKVRGWDDDFFTVMDVARRVGSGIGSYGVDRFYVMLKGEDTLLDQEGSSVILDVKFEPVSAVSTVLKDDADPETRAWYRAMFQNEADRAAQAQRRLTSYTDPYVGYLVIGDDPNDSYNVRQRSPYKSSFDLDTLTGHREFSEFMEQIAVATATVHVRGTVAKSPGQFKHVIKLLLAGSRNRKRWSDLVARIALNYRQQVLLDLECFKKHVEINFHPAFS